MKTIMRFPYKESKVLVPLGLKKYFKINRFKDVNEMDWYDQIRINQNLNITFLPSVHWSKRSLTDTNKTLWGSYLIEYKGCLLYTSPSPRDATLSRMPSSA